MASVIRDFVANGVYSWKSLKVFSVGISTLAPKSSNLMSRANPSIN